MYNRALLKYSAFLLVVIFYFFPLASMAKIDQALKDYLDKYQQSVWLSGSYFYNNFSFLSTSTTSQNRFTGNTKIATAGYSMANFPKWSADVYVYQIKTDINSNFDTAFSQSAAYQKTNSNNFLFVYRRLLQQYLYVEGFAGYGVSDSEITQTFNTIFGQQTGSAKFGGDIWTLGVGTTIPYYVNKVLLTGNIQLFSVGVHQDPYRFTGTLNNNIDAFTSITTNLQEIFRATWLLNQNIHPFVNAGLIQVLKRRTNRPVGANFSENIGPLPALELDNNGYRVGGGVELSFQPIEIYFNYNYYKRGSEYHSNEYFTRLIYMFQ